ncbi:Histone methylation protein [Phytophthora palmivora]|uniref:Histone methylation protein n=1 Tax=Phytophthora palmivora TaxID=4796 RepID=A0A2P4X4Z1_9STRA|nr:Histone methylation protein [Phytophthora palmivora]
MVRTSFCFDDDKELVQLARNYEQDGARISWRDVAHRMRRTRHNANALHQRLKSLMRTHGSRLAQFPRNYFTPVQRPRAVQSVVQAAPSRIPPLSPTSAEHVVAAIFDDVPRQMILGYEGDSIHKNVGDVSDIRLATNSPFAEATVVYWNNVLLEPRVVEHVKNKLCTMANICYLLSCVNFCPCHRLLCLSGFCASFDLMKVVGVPCSWKAKPQSVYIYKSKQNE